MKVLLVGDISGTRDGQQWPPRGTVVDLPDDEALQLVRSGQCRPVVETEMVEMAVGDVVDVEQRGPLTTRTGPAKRRAETV